MTLLPQTLSSQDHKPCFNALLKGILAVPQLGALESLFDSLSKYSPQLVPGPASPEAQPRLCSGLLNVCELMGRQTWEKPAPVWLYNGLQNPQTDNVRLNSHQSCVVS